MTHILLIGHRTSGKSTLARWLAAHRGERVIDLDDHLRDTHGQSAAQLVAQDEPRFRALEQAALSALLDAPEPTIIVPGAGCAPLAHPRALYIWIWREAWHQDALTQRERLRPQWDAEHEIAWMRDTREPGWAAHAHLRLTLPTARTVERAGAELHTLISWLRALPQSDWAARTWLVLADDAQRARALRDVPLLGLAGVEVRSDLSSDARVDEVPVLASLRHADARWLTALPRVDQIDVDLKHLDAALPVLATMPPRPLLLSSHPQRVVLRDRDALISAAKHLRRALPDWAAHLQLKYAPTPQDLDALLTLLSQPRGAHPITILPQGRDAAWARPLLMAQGNPTNYLPVGLSSQRVEGAPATPTPYDLQDWLPHLVAPAPARFEGLLGQPVELSQGDVWHRRAALAQGDDTAYVKIPLAHDASDATLQRALATLHTLGLRGLSVTAPFKRRLLEACDTLHNPDQLDAANTLCRTERGWRCLDTDARGMQAALDAIEASGVTPGTIALFGRGGVSDATTRAIVASRWRLVHHASAREGWTGDTPAHVTLVVNASGDTDAAYQSPPQCDAWLDLHYHQVRPAPAPAHHQGDAFFEAQARAQRDAWATLDPTQ